MGLFGGSKQSSASGHSQSAINSSGWVVGSGSANGGALSASSGGVKLPSYAWVSLAAVAAAFVYYRKKRR